MEFPLLFSIFILLLTIFTAIKVLGRSPASKSPPGPPKLPLIGNLHQLVMKATLPHRCLAELARTYGPIMHLNLGEVPTIIISSADTAKEVMKTHDADICSRPMLLIGKELGYNCSDIGLAPYGEYWRQVQKIFTIFTLKRVNWFRSVREEEVANLVEFMATETGSVVNLSKKLFSFAVDMTYRMSFNKKGKDHEAFRSLIARGSQIASGFSVADLYPSLKGLHLVSGTSAKMQAIVEEANKILDPLIEKHKCSKREGNEEEPLLDVLLKFHKDNVSEADFSLTTDNIKGVIVELFGAGTETSSTAVEWAMSEMLKNPRVLKKAQFEVRQVYEAEQVVDETRLDKLEYLMLVIKETLRLHPPLPLLVPRECMNKCQIYSYEIPPKTRVIINAWAIGRDPEYWSEPHKFIPERFEESPIDFKGTNFEFIPFGAGRRKCPGMALGLANVQLPLANLLYHFDWKLPDTIKCPEDLDMHESFGITMRRKNDLHVIPIPYPYSMFA